MNEQLFSLPFDQFQRYFILQQCLQMVKDHETIPCLSLIDVGGHPGVLSDFLTEDNVTILDSQPCDRPNYVRADACDLPFKDEKFDVVTTVDVFEHISSAKRTTFLKELFRVSKEYIILAAPFDSGEVSLAEEILFEFVKKILGDDFAKVHPLKEHIENGLPSQDALLTRIEQEDAAHITFPNGQLYNWMTLNLIKHYIYSIPQSSDLEKMLDSYYNQYLVSYDVGEPAYRTFFVISKSKKEAVLERISTSFNQKEQTENAGDQLGFGASLPLFELFLTLFRTKADILVSQGKDKDMIDMIDRLEQRMSELEQHIGLVIEASHNDTSNTAKSVLRRLKKWS